jgi:AraC-like DNA-binding protein
MSSLVVCVTHSGGFDQLLPGEEAVVAGPGAVVAAGIHADVPFGGGVRAGRFSQLILEPGSLGEIAGTNGHGDEAVRLTALEPVSAEASDHLVRLVGYVRDVSESALSERTPLLAGEIRRHVAATVLATFPSTADSEPARTDRRDSTPENLRKAIAFIEDNAVRDISLADIAAAVYVTPRTLQYMFRKHRDSTPLEYLRRVRLHYAHLELVSADPLRATVSEIARKWGFGHVGRFAAFHRQEYGRSPHHTLRDEP